MEEKEDFWGEVESSQNEAIPSVMISGEPQTVPATQQMYGAQQQMILVATTLFSAKGHRYFCHYLRGN